MNNEHHSLYCVLCVDSFIGFSKVFFSSVENKNIKWLTVVCPLQYWIQPESENLRFK